MMRKKTDHEPPVRVKLVNLWSGKEFIMSSQKEACRFLNRDSSYIHHVLHSGELARDSKGQAYYVEAMP